MRESAYGRTRAAWSCTVALTLICTAQAWAQSVPTTAESTEATGLNRQERMLGLALLWKEVSYNFPFFDQVPDLDWNATFQRFVGPVLEAGTTLEYYRELQRFVALLQDGHTNVYFPDSIASRRAFDAPWIRLEAVGRRAVVENVRRDLVERLPLGSEIVAVDDTPTERYLIERVLPYVSASTEAIRWRRAIRGNLSGGTGLLVGPPDSYVRLRYRAPTGDERQLEVARDLRSRSGEWAKPPLGREPPFELRWPEEGIAYVALNTFSDAEVVAQFEAARAELTRASGILLDLRANTGGSDFIATAILDHFTDQRLVGSGSRIRVNDALYRAYGSFGETALRGAFPADSAELIERALAHHGDSAWRVDPPDILLPGPGEKIGAPVVLLIGPNVASAAENFLVYLPDDARFTTVGQATVGSTGQPSRIPLPGGGLARVVSRAAVLPDGSTWVGRGIEPDIPVEPTLGDIVADRDVVLERGLEVLRRRVEAAGS